VHVITGVAGAALGVAAGPGLASLTATLGEGRASGRRRLAISAAAAVVLGLLGLRLGWSADLPAFWWFGAAGVALSVIDLDCHRLPNRLIYPSYVAGWLLLGAAAVAQGDGGSYVRALAAMAVVAAAFFGLALVGGIGLGDAKLSGLIALHLAWLGWDALVLGVVAGFAVGAFAALPRILIGRLGWKSEIAFGPALLAGALIGVVL
jgi:leader peptidase (prepilin peptidase)/N-methyltransferase